MMNRDNEVPESKRYTISLVHAKKSQSDITVAYVAEALSLTRLPQQSSITIRHFGLN